uniref:DUF3887 domain-containing protein n=2 Tax=Caenorhabditis tropicalis TaxID=1561998 RepID=A0A1I7UJN3_9PELO
MFLFLFSILAMAEATRFMVIVPESPKEVLENHLKMFQDAIIEGNKEILRTMIPSDEPEDRLDKLIQAHRSIKMEVEEASDSGEYIRGIVYYSKGKAEKVKVNVVIQKDPISQSGYKFVSIIHGGPKRQRNFPTCLIGFIWCYLYLIDIMPGSLDELFG